MKKRKEDARMASVKIDSGELESYLRPGHVPQSQWPKLVKLREWFIGVHMTYDCSCLVQFIQDAEVMWKPLGYADIDDFLTRGYKVDPIEIRLACEWLKHNEPENPIGLPEAIQLGKAQAYALDPDVLPMLTRSEAKIGNDYASKDREENTDSNRICVSDPVRGGTNIDYLVRRLKRDAPEIAEQLGKGEYPSARAAAIAAGIVKVPTALDLLVKAWAKATAAEREAFAKATADDLAKLLPGS